MMQQSQLGFRGDDSDVESEDEDDDESSSASPKSSCNDDAGEVIGEDNISRPFANEAEASKSLKNYTRQTKVTVDQDLALTSSGLNIVKTILPLTLQLMMLSRGNHAFDLFLQLTRVCQVYLYTVLCMFNTCLPCSYDQESIDYTKRLEK